MIVFDKHTNIAYQNAAASPYTRKDGFSTPILLKGVPRRVAISTNPNAEEGRPNGLYPEPQL